MKKLLKPFVLSIFLLEVTMIAVFAQANENPASDFVYSLSQEDDGVIIEEYQGKSKNVVIPAMIEKIPVVKIGYNCFKGKKITSVVIPDTVSRIDGWAFYLSELTQITLPKSLTYIDERAFAFCRLTSLVLPDSVRGIGERAFQENLITELTLPKSLHKIEEGAFYGCVKLQSVTLPESLEKIGSEAFYGCNSLRSITVPANAKSIVFKNNEFTRCPSLPLEEQQKLRRLGYDDHF